MGIRRRKVYYFFQKLEKRKNADHDILSLKSKQNSKIPKNQQEILTEVKTFYEQLCGKKKQYERADWNQS